MSTSYVNEYYYVNTSIPLLLRCATAAQKKGYSVIGLQYYGECWAGHGKGYTKYGATDTCVNGHHKTVANTSTCDTIVGMAETNFVYRIKPTGTILLQTLSIG